MATPLPSYLRSFRKQCGFSQPELAALLGFRTHKSVARHERGAGVPSFEAVVVLEQLFQVRYCDLFPAATRDCEFQLLIRAEIMLARLDWTRPRHSAVKRRLLERVRRRLDYQHRHRS